MKTEKQIRKFMTDILQDVRTMKYDQLVSACNEFLPRIPILPLNFENQPFYFRQNEFGGKNVIYRGRKITNAENRPHQTVAEINYISKENIHKIKSFGRVNGKEESIFYGAIGYPTACFETISKGVDFKNMGSAMVTVGVWIINESFKIVQLPFSKKFWNELNNLTSFNLVRISEDRIDKENERLKKLVGSEIDFEILQFFADAYANFKIECEEDYYISNYYKDRIFNNIKGFKTPVEFEAILYPSVPNGYESDNIVIKPNTIEEKLEFVDAMQVWVVHHKESDGSVQFIPIESRVGSDENGKLKWR